MANSALDFTFAAPGQWKLIGTQTAANSATIDFTGLSSTYAMYCIVIDSAKPVTDAVTFQIRTSSNNGTSYDSGASDYSYSGYYMNQNSNGSGIYSAAAAQIVCTNTIGNAANEYLVGVLELINPSGTATARNMLWRFGYLSESSDNRQGTGYGRRIASASYNAVRLFFSSGNISSGTFTLYGLEA